MIGRRRLLASLVCGHDAAGPTVAAYFSIFPWIDRGSDQMSDGGPMYDRV